MKSKGITLIALVITIIVLLILAGISLSLTLGENGILTKAREATIAHRESIATEEVSMAWASAVAEYREALTRRANQNRKDFFSAQNLNKYTGGENGTGKITRVTRYVDFYEVKYISNDQNAEYIFEVDKNEKVGLAKGNAKDISKDYDTNIGKIVNYEVEGKNIEWRILYSDDNYVYIISKDMGKTGNLGSTVSENSEYKGTDDFKELDTTKYSAVADGWLNKIYDSNNNEILHENNNYNMRATEYILDSKNSEWSDLRNNMAKWVIGGPTLELLVQSYNSVNETKATINYNYSSDKYGYKTTLVGPDRLKDDNRPWSDGNNYWIASPYENNGGNLLYNRAYAIDNCGYLYTTNFRPVICLKSSTVLTLNPETGKYDLQTNLKY